MKKRGYKGWVLPSSLSLANGDMRVDVVLKALLNKFMQVLGKEGMVYVIYI